MESLSSFKPIMEYIQAICNFSTYTHKRTHSKNKTVQNNQRNNYIHVVSQYLEAVVKVQS